MQRSHGAVVVMRMLRSVASFSACLASSSVTQTQGRKPQVQASSSAMALDSNDRN